MYTFPVDRDVIVGRDRECDICFRDVDPDDLTLISRVHAILRFDSGRWVVVDKSQNGLYVDGSRANLVPIRDHLSVALGSPRGPQLTFRVATPSPSRARHPTGSSWPGIRASARALLGETATTCGASPTSIVSVTV